MVVGLVLWLQRIPLNRANLLSMLKDMLRNLRNDVALAIFSNFLLLTMRFFPAVMNKQFGRIAMVNVALENSVMRYR